MPSASNTQITILLCTLDGAEHLEEQLASFEAQTHKNWTLWVSDDGSEDETIEILQRWKARLPQRHDVRLITGSGKGAAANFMSLLTHQDLPLCHVALSGQDDVWHADKLQRALECMAALPFDQPALYGAQSIYTDSNLRPTGRSKVPLRPPGFANALTQNIVSGHSATLNAAGLALVRRTGIPAKIPFHDWWLYQLITGAGGWVLIDDQAVLSYRQHGNNLLGAHRGMGPVRQRLNLIFNGSYGEWIGHNLAALRNIAEELSPEHRAKVLRLCNSQRGPVRMLRMARAGLHRQRISNTAIFYLAALFGRL